MVRASNKRTADDGIQDGIHATPRKGVNKKNSKHEIEIQDTLPHPSRSSSRSSRSSRLQPPDIIDGNTLCAPCNSTDSVPQPPSRYFYSRDPDITCLAFLLDPTIARHRAIICAVCYTFWDKALKNILGRHLLPKNKRSLKGVGYQCLRPWYPGKADHAWSGKQKHMADFYDFFEWNSKTRAITNEAQPSSQSTASASTADTSSSVAKKQVQPKKITPKKRVGEECMDH